MSIRSLFATPSSETEELMISILHSARQLMLIEVSTSIAHSIEVLRARVAAEQDDTIFLDWELAGQETPALVRELTTLNPRIRIVVLLPESLRQYRYEVWESGACNSIPKEYMDQEWLSSVLCIMHRAMQREARILERFASKI